MGLGLRLLLFLFVFALVSPAGAYVQLLSYRSLLFDAAVAAAISVVIIHHHTLLLLQQLFVFCRAEQHRHTSDAGGVALFAIQCNEKEKNFLT